MTEAERISLNERLTNGNSVLIANSDIEFFEKDHIGQSFTKQYGWFSTLYTKGV
jgi:hypothetical protein